MNETKNRYLELDNVDRRTIDALKGIGILWIVLDDPNFKLCTVSLFSIE